ncbi:hypothetical protein [Companilactobacillus sp. DQM5]|uniref:hypothetical protein n=1 Tax=Companilactobacillus sp. DQM5 TaxID=3463359 RepID=UPI004058FFB3
MSEDVDSDLVEFFIKILMKSIKNDGFGIPLYTFILDDDSYYYLSLSLPKKEDEHELTRYNKQYLDKVALCGCCYCLDIFETSRINEWTDDGETAICPYCDIDAVIPEKNGYDISPQFLKELRKKWF